MNATLIAIGSELVHAGREDSNGAWIAERLGRLGVRVRARVAVEDDRMAIAGFLQDASESSDLVILTGGLGPTEDDRTREAVAAALGVELERDPAQVRILQRRFEDRGFEFLPHQARQAERPAGADWLPNPLGTAPGFIAAAASARIVALPGVPSEMRAMFEVGVVTWLEGLPRGASARRVIKIAGRHESWVDRRIQDLYDRPGAVVTILARLSGIEIHLGTEAADPEQAIRQLDALDGDVVERVGDHVFGRDDDTLAAAAGHALRASHRTVATAESCTAGMIAAEITTVPGSTEWFRGGLVVYDNDLKHRLAGVHPPTIEAHGAVSPEVARELADGARTRCGADIGIGVTGVAGPEGGTADKPVGLVHLALYDGIEFRDRRILLPGDRAQIRARTVTAALDLLWRHVRPGP